MEFDSNAKNQLGLLKVYQQQYAKSLELIWMASGEKTWNAGPSIASNADNITSWSKQNRN